MDDWLNVLVRRHASDISAGRHFEGQLACTSYDPKTHAVKGIIVPHMLETGWIPLQAIHTSGDKGSAMYIGAKPGDASSLKSKFDGDLLDIKFDLGDPNSISARHRSAQPSNPPEVQSGEVLIQHEKGSHSYFKQDGSHEFKHFAKEGTQTWDKDGHLSVDTKDQNITITSGKGSQTFSAKSQSFTADNISIKGAVAVDGDITQNGSHTATNVISGGSVKSGGHPVQTV